jgi:lipopolysaccharide/colanic/teichoic acid biosynthesis glycosyltransferase
VGVITAILSLVSLIVLAVISRLVADDVKAWLPRITRHLIEVAVRRLPEDQRERYVEEWTAFIDDTPGDLSKICRAASLSWAALSIARAAGSTRVTEIGTRREDGVWRLSDLFIGSVALLSVSAMLMVTMLAMRINGPDPFLAAYPRVGRNGKVFYLLMIRTTSGTADDTTVTRIGRFLRKTRLDGIPQLINIMRGEMSFVGPRPESPDVVNELSELIPEYRERSAVRPGLVGWQQISGSCGTSLDDVKRGLQLDQYYIENRGFLFDLRILLMATRSMLLRQQTD